MTERLVRKRLWTGPQITRSVEPEPDILKNEAEVTDKKGGLRNDEVYRSSHHALLPDNPQSTVGNVVDWQLLHHPGFVPAFISTIRYAPIHDQHDRWRILRKHIEQGSTTSLCKVHLVLGETDPIILADELVEDAKELLSEDLLDVEIIKNVGHEVAISHADEVSDLVERVLH